MDKLDLAWADILRFLSQPNAQSIEGSTLELLKSEPQLKPKLFDFLTKRLEEKLNFEIAPAFWRYFNESSSPFGNNQVLSERKRIEEQIFGFDKFHKAVTDLYVRVQSEVEFCKRLDYLSGILGHKVKLFARNSYVSYYPLLLKGTLHSQLPISSFERIPFAFYGRAFHVFFTRQNNLDDSNNEDDEDEDSILECKGCYKEQNNCECNAILSIFHDVNRKLIEMDLAERLVSRVLTSIVRVRIEKYVEDSCKGSFQAHFLKPLEDWLDDVILGWIRVIYLSSPLSSSTTVSDGFRSQLRGFLYRIYANDRIDQLFNIIIEFPDSQPALDDLRECLDRAPNLRSKLITSLKNTLKKKLLHLGVNTTDILTAYVAAIKALRVLDPTGVILEVVCEPVRSYLRTREDTVRCIVQNLIDDNSSELADELKKNEGLALDESFYEEENMDNWKTWMPDPIDGTGGVIHTKSSKQRRTSDIISMLINIYGSKELFVNEYRALLSNRLLNQMTYETEKEIRNLELLKLRFGETPLHQCEVMLKDIGDSKRINGLLSNECSELKKLPFPVNSVIVSAQFWPQFKQQDNLQLPNEVSKSLEVYTRGFETVKVNRTLVWKPNLGYANIDLEIGEKKVNLTVSPILAAIIYQFQLQSEWTAEDLAYSLKIPISMLRRRIGFWKSQGFVREPETDKYQLIDDSTSGKTGEAPGDVIPSSSIVHDEDEDESATVTKTAQDARDEELQFYWPYIKNMLINLEQLPLERIYQMLKMFAMQAQSSGDKECEVEDVRGFLDKKVRERELQFSGGQYKLAKN